MLIVTGAGRGIGAATSILAAARGYHVGVNYRSNADAARKVVSCIKNEGGTAVAIQADVAEEDQVIAMFKSVEQQLGRITALVNNAGILESQMRLDQMDGARIDRVFATNVRGSFLCAREAVRTMSSKHGGAGGSIVNVSSAASRLGSPDEYIDYAASKGAIDSMTIGLSKEVAQEGIRVNAVRPGVIDTEIHASGGEPNRLERVSKTVPMLRGGSADEVAEAIIWLLSAQASYCTGTFIDITGGR